MSTQPGENKDGQEWPTQDNVIALPFERLELDHYRHLSDTELAPRSHARLANQFRDDYIMMGEAESLGRALHHYDAALKGSNKEPLLQAWIICNRANLYIHDLPTGKVMLGDLDEELTQARKLLSRSLTLKDKTFKMRTLAWIERTRATYFTDPARMEATQEFNVPALRLVGGKAIEGAAGPVPAPGPGAA